MSDDLVATFSASTMRFPKVVDDPRMYPKTAEALSKVGPIDYPSKSTPRSEVVEWWKSMGPAFASVMADWAGDVPDDIASTVLKTDLEVEGVPVRVLKHKDAIKEGLPTVVYLHGGGFTAWSYQDKTYDGYLTRLAALNQCVIVAVDFCSAHDRPYPASLDDCYVVTQQVVEGKVGDVPPGKVVLAGDSAGANLAFAVALRTKQASQDWIKGLYYICPYWDGVTQSEKYPSTLELNGYFASVGFLQAVVSNVCKEDEQDEWSQNALLWPIHATEEDLSGMPPTRTIVMQLDMIRDMGLAFHYKLHEADVDCTFSLVSGGVHEQQLFAAHSPQVTDQSIRDLAGFAQYVSK